jgi:hypothetical protein
MRRTLWIVGALALFGGGLVIEHVHAARANAELAARVEALDRKGAARSEPSVTRVERCDTAAVAPAAPAAQPAMTAVPERGAPTLRVQKPPSPRSRSTAAEEFEATRNALDAVFAAEPEDPAWARAARLTASRALSAALPSSSRIESLECKESLCRIESSHASFDASQEFVRDGFLSLEQRPWDGDFVTGLAEEPRGGRVRTVTFLMRPGKTLPDLDDG